VSIPVSSLGPVNLLSLCFGYCRPLVEWDCSKCKVTKVLKSTAHHTYAFSTSWEDSDTIEVSLERQTSEGHPREVQSKETYMYVVIYRCMCVTRLALTGVGVLIAYTYL